MSFGIPRNNRSDCDRCPSWIVESVPVKESCCIGLVLDRLDPLDRWRSSVEKSPTESVLVDLDLFCVRILDPSWTRFLPPKRLGPLKRVLPMWKESYQKCPTCFGLVLDRLKCCSVERVLHILDSFWTRVLTSENVRLAKHLARLRPLGVVLTAETAVLTALWRVDISYVSSCL